MWAKFLRASGSFADSPGGVAKSCPAIPQQPPSCYREHHRHHPSWHRSSSTRKHATYADQPSGTCQRIGLWIPRYVALFHVLNIRVCVNLPGARSFKRLMPTCRLLVPSHQIISGSQLTSELVSILSQCPSDFYLLIKQAGVRVSDFSSPTSAPTLSRFYDRASHSTLRSSVAIPDVVGETDLHLLERELNGKCGARSTAVDASGTQIVLTTAAVPLTLL